MRTCSGDSQIMAYDPEYYRLYRIRNAEKIKQASRDWYAANAEKVKNRVKQWAADNHDRKLATQREYNAANGDKRRAYMRERYKTKRDDIIEYNRKRRAERPQVEQDWYLRKEYGLTLAEYDAMLAAQDGCCAICRKQHKRRLAVDHDHNTGRVRGLLCSSCNNGLGRFEDDADRMRRAVDYLDESKRRS